MRTACPTERPITPTGKVAFAEKRLSALLEAVRMVRPALETYYNTLNDEQKMRLTLAQRQMEGHGMAGHWKEPANFRTRVWSALDGAPSDARTLSLFSFEGTPLS